MEQLFAADQELSYREPARTFSKGGDVVWVTTER